VISTVALMACLCLPSMAQPTPAASDFNFDLIETPAPVADLKLDRAITTRRTMLQAHQAMGLTTLSLMAATVVLGQLNYNDMYTRAGAHRGNLALSHRILAYTTSGAFVATASLSLFAPVPYEKRAPGLDTATIHRTSVALASAGMVTQLVLGFVTARQADAGNGHRLEGYIKAHQIIGYTTLACLTTAAVVWVF
jgi:hypothetical protein